MVRVVMKTVDPQRLSPLYQAYLVRLWRENDTVPWRVTIKHIRTQEMHHFAAVEEYITFLYTQTDPKEQDT